MTPRELAYRSALAIRPNWEAAAFGILCVRRHRSDPTLISALEDFLSVNPEHISARLMCAELLTERDPVAAVALLRQAQAEDPRLHAQAAHSLIVHFDNLQALQCMGRALSLDPGNSEYLTFRTFTRMIVPAAAPTEPISVIRQHLRTFAESHFPLQEAGPYRIGYLTQDYRNHPAANFLMPLLLGHRRNLFSPIAITNLAEPDALTPRLLGAADEVINISDMNDSSALKRLRAAGLSVIIDFSGWSVGNRLPLLAHRVAPVHITAIGVYLTTGLPAIDFRICDAASDPPGLTEGQHSETLLRTAGPHACYYELRPIPASLIQPARINGHFTFGFFNNSAKITREMVSQWIQILAGVPSARLKILGVRDAASRRWLAKRFDEAGVASRVSVLGRIGVNEYQSTLTTVDLALDSHPYNGGTTTIECLLAGVPVLTHSGQWPFSRSARVFLDPLGLSDWAVDSAEVFVQRAVQIACGPLEPLETLRIDLPQRVRRTTLMDMPGYIERWEAVLLRAIELRRAACGDGMPAEIET